MDRKTPAQTVPSAPFPPDEAARLTALDRYKILDTAPEDAYDDLVRLAAFLCGTPIAAVSLIDLQRQWFKSILGLPVTETPRDIAFCAHTITGRDIFVIPDAQSDPRFAANPLVTGDPDIRFYAGVPLVTDDGHALGSLCVLDRVPRDLTPEQREALRVLARQVVGQMELAKRLAEQERLTAERDMAEEMRRAGDDSLRQLGTALERANDGVVLADAQAPDLPITYANPAFLGSTGYERSEVLGRNCRFLQGPGTDPAAVARLGRALRNGLPCRVTLQNYRKDGSAFWNQLSVTPIRSAAGELTHFVGIQHDVTAQKQAEEQRLRMEQSQHRALQRAEQILRAETALGAALTTEAVAGVILEAALPIFAASMGLVVLLSEDGATLSTVQVRGVPPDLADPWRRFPLDAPLPLADAVRERRLVVLASPEAHDDAYGHLVETLSRLGLVGALVAVPLLVGERCVGGLGLICPPAQYQEEGQEAFLWTLAGQCALALERARLYDKARHELEERLRAEEERLRAEEERLRAEDALRRSERRLRLTLERGEFGTFDLDLVTGRYAEISDICRSQFAMPPEGDISVADFFALVHPEDRAPLQDVLAKASAAHEEDFTCDYRITPPGGDVRWISVSGSLLYEEPGHPLRMVGVTQDITGRKRQEAERERALVRAQEQADCDPLTGLLNHRAFHSRLQQECDLAGWQRTPLAVAALDLDGFKFFNDAYGHAVGDEVLRRIADRLRRVRGPGDTVARFGGDEFALILPDSGGATAGEIEARLRDDLAGLTYQPRDGGTAIPLTLSVGAAIFAAGDQDRHEALRRADERLRRAKTGGDPDSPAGLIRDSAGRSVSGFSLLDALVTAVDNKDRYTRRHSEDVLAYSLLIARELGLDEAAQSAIGVAALLHDVGKIGVPDAILRKPGRLTDAEFAAMQQHPQMGAIIVGAVPGLEDTLDAIRHHHERWDGGGYPFGLRGAETPLIARLMAVADAFSAMTTDRPYRKGMARREALALLAAGAGTQWDPACVEAFLRASPDPV